MIKTVRDINLNNKTVLIRCDFNVPIKDGVITDDTRIVESLKTIKYVLSKNCKIILFSHLGRIKEASDLAKNNLDKVAIRLQELLNKKVTFIPETRGETLEKAIKEMNNGDIILVQNTRYEDLNGKKESSNDQELAKYWASLGDVFINDAFGTIHRSHASNVGIASYLESAIGFLVEKELKALQELNNPKRPYVVILGGAKVSDKIGVINNLINKADYILIGGGMSFTFLKAEGHEIGKSLLDSSHLEYCSNILKEYQDKLILPIDITTSKEFSNDTPFTTKSINEIEKDDIGLDIGIETIKSFEQILSTAKTVVWNGPLGVCEMSNFKKGTLDILNYLAENNIKTIIGGGDTAAVISNNKSLKDKIYHISTGGGATLEYLEGKTLPGLKVLDKEA